MTIDIKPDEGEQYFPPPGSAGDLLAEAAKIVEGARGQTHGAKERSFGVIASLWNAYIAGRRYGLGHNPGLLASDVAAMMTLLKIARGVQGDFVRDHAVDAAGYAGIMGELALMESDWRKASPPSSIVEWNEPEHIGHVAEAAINAEAQANADAIETLRGLYEDARIAADAEFKRRCEESGKRLAAERERDEARMELVMLRSLVEDAEKRLDLAAIAFRGYADHHRTKTPPDDVKAHRNEEMAALCEGKAAVGMAERPKRITDPVHALTNDR